MHSQFATSIGLRPGSRFLILVGLALLSGSVGACSRLAGAPFPPAQRSVEAQLRAAREMAENITGPHLSFLLVETHLRAAREMADRYDFERAREHLAQCLRLAPDRADLRLLAARTARRAGDYDEAAKHLAACRRLGVKADDVKLEESLAQAQRGDLDDVEESLRALVKKDHPDSRLIREALIRGYLASYRLREANMCLLQWLEGRPDDPQAYFWRGHMNEQWDGDRDGDALANYRRVLELDPKHDKAQLRLANAMLEHSSPYFALKHFQDLQKRRPKDLTIRLGIARCRMMQGEEVEARKLLDDLLAEQPRNAAALKQRGKLALQQHQPAEAEKWLREALAVTPADYEAHYQLFLSLKTVGKEEEARKCHRRFSQIRDDMQRLQEMSKKMSRSSWRDPNLRSEVGVLLLRNDREQEGLRWLLAALKLDPRHRATHRALADYYLHIGDEGRAAQHQRLARE